MEKRERGIGREEEEGVVTGEKGVRGIREKEREMEEENEEEGRDQ